MPHQAHRPAFALRLSHRDVTTHNARDLSLQFEERRMARVPYVDNKDLPERYRNQLSSDANVTRALSNSPQLAFLSGSMARTSATKARSIRGCANSQSSRLAIRHARLTNTRTTSRSVYRSA
jgi:hypothetical protein